MQAQEFSGCEPVVKAEMLWQKTNASTYLGLPQGFAEQAPLTRSGLNQPQEHLDGGCFASAVGA